MGSRDTSVAKLCRELGIERVTLYRYVNLKGRLREHGWRYVFEKSSGTFGRRSVLGGKLGVAT